MSNAIATDVAAIPAKANSESVTLTNATTGQAINVPIDAAHPIIPATLLKQLQVLPANPPPRDPEDTVGLCLYDPGFSNTVACKSRISHVSGATGQLLYRGYPIEDLYEHSSFTEVAYLLVHGDLPSKPQFDHWQRQLLRHTYLHSELERQLATFRWDAHPMGMLIAGLSSLSSFHPEANPALVGDALYTAGPREQYVPYYKLGSLHATEAPTATQVRDHVRNKQVYRILGKLPTIAANVFRHREGRPYNHPMPSPRSITENFLYMLDKLNEPDYVPDRVLVQLLDKAFILLAEHGSSCSTITMRHLVSSGVDPFTATSGACGALFGERKSSEVIRMLEHIASVDGIANYLDLVKQKKSLPHLPRAPTSVPTAEAPKGIPIPSAPLKLQGWGHRIYKGPDPRVRLMRDLTLKCFQHIYRADPEAQSTHLVYLALQLEKVVLADEYFIARKIFPNIDFWTAILFHTMGFPRDMFAVLMTIPRSAGYLAHFIECVSAKEQIYRPRQVYLGETLRDYVSVGDRNSGLDNSDAKSVAAKSSHALETVSVRSNPAAQVRRSLSEATNLHEVTALIEQTRRQITHLADELSTSLDEAANARSASPSGGGPGADGTWANGALMSLSPSASHASQSAAVAAASGTPRILRRLVSAVQSRVRQATGAPQPAAPAPVVDPEVQVQTFAAMAERLEMRQAELRDLLDVQRELLKVQANLKRGTHASDAVNLEAFEKIQ